MLNISDGVQDAGEESRKYRDKRWFIILSSMDKKEV